MPDLHVDIHGAVLLAHAFATLLMCGLCWFVQVVHYPLLAAVGPERFEWYEHEHVRRTTRIVAPLMLVELATAATIAGFAWNDASGRPPTLAASGLALLAMVWTLTFGVLVPLHARLRRGFDLEAVRALVRWNWPRTTLWTARGVIALALLHDGAGVSP